MSLTLLLFQRARSLINQCRVRARRVQGNRKVSLDQGEPKRNLVQGRTGCMCSAGAIKGLMYKAVRADARYDHARGAANEPRCSLGAGSFGVESKPNRQASGERVAQRAGAYPGQSCVLTSAAGWRPGEGGPSQVTPRPPEQPRRQEIVVGTGPYLEARGTWQSPRECG